MEERLANRALSRRSFIKAAAVTAGIAALSGSAGTLTALAETAEVGSAEDVKRIRTVCRACGKMECGVWVTVKDGKAIRVEGDQSSFTSRGNCCTKSQSSIQACYHPDRLRYPMKRTNPKGEDPGWVRISWDEAMALSAEKFTEIQNKYGGPSLLTMNGTSRMWAICSPEDYSGHPQRPLGFCHLQGSPFLYHRRDRHVRFQLDDFCRGASCLR